MQEDNVLEKSMPKRKPPLIKIDFAGLVAAIRATHLIEG